MSMLDATRALFRCDGANVPQELAQQPWDVDLPLLTEGSTASLNLHIEGLASKVVGALDARAADLVRIAAYAYGADQVVSRGGLDVHRQQWRRRMTLCVPVSDPGFWAQPSTTTALAETLGFGTEDSWSFHFTQRPEATQQIKLEVDHQPLEDRPLMGEPDSVMLVSGGIDSLCALVEAIAVHGARPVVVSHRSTPVADAVQKEVLDGVRAHFRTWSLPPMSFWIHRNGSEAQDSTQRTRGFLFAALGMAVAGQVGLQRVLLPDNGYVSLNPAYNDQLVGALNSRGTHPTFLRLVNELAALIFPAGVRFENPLADRTRAEALSILKAHEVGELVGLTRSCGKHRGRPKQVPHCGGCSQCVDRRFAVVAAGLEAYDPANRYEADLFRGPLKTDEARTVAVSYVRFARETEQVSADELYAEHEELIGALDATDPAFTRRATCLANVLTRHAQEAMRVMGVMYARHGEDLARGALAEPNLLALTALDAEAGGTPSVPSVTTTQIDAPAAEPSRHRLARRARQWHITFRGEKGIVPHSKGLYRLARLVKARGQSLLALDLVSGSNPSKGAPVYRPDDEAEADVDTVYADQPGRKSWRRVDSTVDPLARAEELNELLQNEMLADRDRDGILAELDSITDRMLAESDQGGPEHSKNDEFERARTAVRLSMRKAYNDIGAELPALKAHFLESVHFGVRCWYEPRPPEYWDVDLGDRPSPKV